MFKSKLTSSFIKKLKNRCFYMCIQLIFGATFTIMIVLAILFEMAWFLAIFIILAFHWLLEMCFLINIICNFCSCDKNTEIGVKLFVNTCILFTFVFLHKKLTVIFHFT